jgi:hypothetical protein
MVHLPAEDLIFPAFLMFFGCYGLIPLSWQSIREIKNLLFGMGRNATGSKELL